MAVTGESFALQCFHVSDDAFGKSIESISALQNGNDATVTEFVGQLHDDTSHRGVALGSDVELTEQVIAHAVETGADEDEIGFEVSRCRYQLRFEGLKELGVACARRHGHIQNFAASGSPACFLPRTGSRI